ncbi:type II toxin-antitoxin system HicB family antitoxin [Dyadobacter sp. CY345]|uniref:type II toxin-antitoxin system HicB family antitoxin n=1 Tax=Dyadobacter sp. CY345 TaxID=2909335 RepID=UPI001F4003C1|nr:type II toxin-antitoxin system HicB family antitoxin [Dyadobacter sp. CY345]MCF2444295.1 type II toxin-antitoxin system HicB family antitoxin [Dyadobacter sp. CY345]
MKLTVVIIQGETQLVGSIKEIPGVITQEIDRNEVMENIHDALNLYLEDMRSEISIN